MLLLCDFFDAGSTSSHIQTQTLGLQLYHYSTSFTLLKTTRSACQEIVRQSLDQAHALRR
jgi:hypothetical protein